MDPNNHLPTPAQMMAEARRRKKAEAEAARAHAAQEYAVRQLLADAFEDTDPRFLAAFAMLDQLKGPKGEQ